MVERQDSIHNSSHYSSEVALLLDVSHAGNSAQACQLADEFVARLADAPVGVMVDINAGDLLLTRGVLTKIRQQIQRASAAIGIVYATVPQTQQAALDEGLFVKEKLSAGWTPIRQQLPLGKTSTASQPPAPRLSGGLSGEQASVKGVDLPDFSQPRSTVPESDDFEVVAPQSLDVPELAEPEPEPEMEEQLDLVLETEQMELPEGIFEVVATVGPQEVLVSDTAFETLYLRQTLRSGQTVRFNGNIVIVGDVHAGSEITAGGDIVVWGELRGIAHAGAQGNYKAEVRAMKIEALQLRIAEYIARRPDRIYYHKDGGEQVLSPEVARVADGEIKIFKTMFPKG